MSGFPPAPGHPTPSVTPLERELIHAMEQFADRTGPARIDAVAIQRRTWRCRTAMIGPVAVAAAVLAAAGAALALQTAPRTTSAAAVPAATVAACPPGATGPAIPNLTGMTRVQALQDLNAAGFTARIRTMPSDTIPPGDVITQTPAASTHDPHGTAVTLYISNGQSKTGAARQSVPLPAPCPSNPTGLPDFSGMTQARALKTIQAAGFTARIRTMPSDTIPPGDVITQSPKPGTHSSPGSTITVFVSTIH